MYHRWHHGGTGLACWGPCVFLYGLSVVDYEQLSEIQEIEEPILDKNTPKQNNSLPSCRFALCSLTFVTRTSVQIRGR